MAPNNNGLRDLINQTAAVQVEALGASAKLWGTWLDTMAWYGWEVSQSVSKVATTNANANMEIRRLVKDGQQRLKRLQALPAEIGSEFSDKVTRRLTGRPAANPKKSPRRQKKGSGKKR